MPPRTAAPPWRQASCLTCQNAPPPGRPEAVTMAPPLVPSPTTADADSRAPFPRRADVPVRSHAQSARRSQTVHALFHGPPPPPEPGSGTGILPVRWRRQTRAGLTPNGRLTGQAGRLSHYGVGAPVRGEGGRSPGEGAPRRKELQENRARVRGGQRPPLFGNRSTDTCSIEGGRPGRGVRGVHAASTHQASAGRRFGGRWRIRTVKRAEARAPHAIPQGSVISARPRGAGGRRHKHRGNLSNADRSLARAHLTFLQVRFICVRW